MIATTLNLSTGHIVEAADLLAGTFDSNHDR
jgi:hypothetical protein